VLPREAGAKPVSTSTTAWLSGLSLRHVTRRGPSWRCADRVHIGYASLRALHPETCFPDPVSIDRLSLPFLRPAHAPDSYPPGRPSGDGGSPVTLLLGHQRPDDARHPVGQRHGAQHPRLARQHPGEPRIVRPAVPDRPADDRHGTRDQQEPEIALAHLRYLAQPRLAAGRVLARHKAEPGSEVPAAPEGLHRRCEDLDRHRGDRADPRHAHQAPCFCILPCAPVGFLLQALDLRVEPGDLFEQKRAQLADRVRQVRVWILKRRRQAVDMDPTLGRNDAELREMAA